MPGVELKSVSRHFGAVVAVRDVSLAVPDGSFVTFLGPSGCGKTTTLRMIAGLERNDGGSIAIGDRIVSDAARSRFVPAEHRNIGMVFQSYAIWPHMTVFENVAYPLRIRKMKAADVRKKTLSALRLVEMESYADRLATALSGGQQQRVAIARAVVFEPSLLLLDEPLSNLDAKLREQMRIELRGLQKRLGITTVYVTHDQEEAMALSDRIVVMRHGEVLQDAQPESVYFRPASIEVAAFCGNPNILAATVVESGFVSEGIHLVKVTGEGWQGWARAEGAIAVGREVSVIARPENINVAAVDANPPSNPTPFLEWEGEIAQNVFGGFRRTLVARAGNLDIVVDAPADRQLPVGAKVRLSIASARTWVLEERTSTTAEEP